MEGEQAFILKYLEENKIPWSLAHDYVFAENVSFNQPLHYDEFILSRTDNGFYLGKSNHFHSIQIEIPGNYEFPIGQLSVELLDVESFETNQDPNVEYVSAINLQWPLYIRKVKDGDRFNPLGMQGRTKKLQDFFTDLKLSSHEKSSTYVLTSCDQIVWVIGRRMDEKFKLSEGSTKVYKLTFCPV